MPTFTVRVELHKADPASYDALHQAMARAGFSNEVQGEDGAIYLLPLGEYSMKDSSLSGREVRDLTKKAALTSGKEASILVTEGRRFWSGLERK